MPISLSEGNAKLVKTNGETYKVLGFGIPADYSAVLMGEYMNTCPGASACRGVCYAKQGRYAMPNVYNAKMGNLKESILPTFVEKMVDELERRRSYNVIRIHDAGDFYNQQYYDRWCDIADALPDRIFYAYTKSLHLDLYMLRPDNLRIIQSLGGKHDSLVDMTRPHARIFSSDDARIAAGYVDGNVNDIPAIEGVNKIGLTYHGVKKLTLPQVKFFS